MIEQTLAIDNTPLHALAGVMMFLVFAFLVPSRGNWMIAWLAVLGITIWNEAVDIATERWPNISEQYVEAVFDLWVTLAFPTIALLIVIVWNQFPGAKDQEA